MAAISAARRLFGNGMNKMVIKSMIPVKRALALALALPTAGCVRSGRSRRGGCESTVQGSVDQVATRAQQLLTKIVQKG
jgi:hypothetical protein